MTCLGVWSCACGANRIFERDEDEDEDDDDDDGVVLVPKHMESVK